jgi:hypothetical protein
MLSVFAVFSAACIFASAYYRYAARMQIENANQPWNRKAAS